MQNTFVIYADLKKDKYYKTPEVTANDDIQFVVHITDNGLPFDLSEVTTFSLASERPDKVVVVTNGVKMGTNQVSFSLGNSELSVIGKVNATVQLYDADERISTVSFSYNVSKDPTGNGYIPSETEQTLIQVVLGDGPLVIQEAIEAGDYANDMGDYALSVGDSNKTRYLPSVTTVALRNSTYPTPLHGDTVRVTEDTPYPSTYRYVTGTGWTKVDENNPTAVNQALTQLEETARQTTTLSSGVSVVSGGVDAIADVEIEGRTLTSLGNSNLEATKQYVLADSKTKVVVDGVTQSGVAKFTKGTTTVSTANFVNKVSGSTVTNPHVGKSLGGIGLAVPSSVDFTEFITGYYTNSSSLNGTNYQFNAFLGNGRQAQQLFSFDIIAEIERKLGVIPRSTLAEKVQWVKDNADTLVVNWHGFGSSVGGNKATVSWWYPTLNAWEVNGASTHTNGVVTRITKGFASTSMPNLVDGNGLVHYLAYAEPSDGTTPSSISTDYIDLVVTLKPTAQLNTRPTIIRVENFEGKVSGSVVENPHTFKGKQSNPLSAPSTFSYEGLGFDYTMVGSLNGSTSDVARTGVSGFIAQHLFSFNLIEAVERNIGKIPRSTVADKVQWLKDNVRRLVTRWWGFGSSPTGNNANFLIWQARTSGWISSGSTSHSLNTVSSLWNAVYSSDMSYWEMIDTNGFVHLIAYAEPSDGSTASTINTDYIDLEIELKPTADFTKPKVALYEVTSDSYGKILVDWNADEVKKRYPIVEGTQHLQGVGVIAEGENLLPPFSEWTLHANAKVISPYELELVGTGNTHQFSYIHIPVTIGQTYTRDGIVSGGTSFYFFKKDKTVNPNYQEGINLLPTFTVDSSFNGFITVIFNVYGAITAKLSNPILILGSTAKPFVPRNPSYLYADVKLGAIGTSKDVLYEQDGSRFVRKIVEKDVVLDGSLVWGFNSSATGYKQVSVVLTGIPLYAKINATKYDGKLLENFTSGASTKAGQIWSSADKPRTTVSNLDTGWGESYTPTSSDIKRYFNGWKYSDGTTWTSVTGNGQTATAQVALDTKPTDYTPYKLSYVLATPQVVNVTDKVEGSLKVNGSTQVEVLSGVVRMEKVVPYVHPSNGKVYINTANVGAFLKNKVRSILRIYKNGIIDNAWSIFSDASNGAFSASILSADYAPTAEYTVTYLALDKHLLTANPTSVKLIYANNIRSALEDVVGEVSDNSTTLSVHEKAIVDLYVRVKALEG